MSLFWRLSLALMFAAIIGLMFFGVHGAACAMHVAAVERLWSKYPDNHRYEWSHAYCVVVSAPIRLLLP